MKKDRKCLQYCSIHLMKNTLCETSRISFYNDRSILSQVKNLTLLGSNSLNTCVQLVASSHSEILWWEMLDSVSAKILCWCKNTSQNFQNSQRKVSLSVSWQYFVDLLHCLQWKPWQCGFREGWKEVLGCPSTETQPLKGYGAIWIHAAWQDPHLSRICSGQGGFQSTFRMYNETINTNP